MFSDRGDRGLFTIWTRSFWIKIIFPFPLSPAIWISDYFEIKDAVQTMEQWRIEVSCVNGDVDKIRVISRKVLFDPHRYLSNYNRLFILLESAETEIRFSMANSMFKMKMDIDRHGPRLMPNNCKHLNPPYFSLPTTLNALLGVHHVGGWVVIKHVALGVPAPTPG